MKGGPVGDSELLLCHGMVCVVGRMRDLILQLSKSSIYSTCHFKQKEMLAIEMGEYYKGGARAQIVQKVEKQLFDLYKDPNLNVKPKELEQRGGAYYSDAACEVINAIYNDKQAEHYVNVRITAMSTIFRLTGPLK
jgi:alpha-galactosidase/6-phospho-beta-glucosidase family protein